MFNFKGGSSGKDCLPMQEMQEAQAQSLAGTIPWRKKWQPTPVIFALKNPWTEETGGLQSMGFQRVRHDWVTEHIHNFKTSKCPLDKSEIFLLPKNSFSIRKHAQDFPGGPVAKILPANEGNTRWPLVREGATSHRATEPMCHYHWAGLTPLLLALRLHKRSRRSERPACRNEEWPRLIATRESKACVQHRRPGTAKNINFF